MRFFVPFVLVVSITLASLFVVLTRIPTSSAPHLNYQPRLPIDVTGYGTVNNMIAAWPNGRDLNEIKKRFASIGDNVEQLLDQYINDPATPADQHCAMLLAKASAMQYEGRSDEAYRVLSDLRKILDKNSTLAEKYLYTTIYCQGVIALRKGENDNCIMCRGESSCILPISAAAMHKNTEGSRLAIQHFTEYLKAYPNDLEVRWLLNVAHMTLGEHPGKVDPRYVVRLDTYLDDSHSVGRFRDIGAIVGINRLNQAGGGIMEDFDNDGLLDIVVTSFDPTQTMGYFRNTGDGKFEDLTAAAGLTDQVGGLNCMQTDYNNDGLMDVFIVRGAWYDQDKSMRPSLLRNNGDRTFTDVTAEAGLQGPVNSIAAAWGDYDNDGWLDVFVCCEKQQNRLYHNLKNGTFEEVAGRAGISTPEIFVGKGATWGDYNRDGYLDLFVNNLSAAGPRLYVNKGDGSFRDGTAEFGIKGPISGFSCWSFDYDNDGWLDIFATCYHKTLDAAVKDLVGIPQTYAKTKLYRNINGTHFEDVSQAAGVDKVYVAMGSNFGDVDNDGNLDIYLGTGDPDITMLVPNRMLRNVDGKRFAEITSTSGTGNLQKGHGVSFADWDRDGNVDIFIEMGGATNGDKYHNILFQNPGHDNDWITIKLIGVKTNRAAMGARIRIVTAGPESKTLYRTISTGSSFGANPLEQTVGLGHTDSIQRLEIEWPVSGTTQVFENVPVRQHLEISEFASEYKTLARDRIVWDK